MAELRQGQRRKLKNGEQPSTRWLTVQTEGHHSPEQWQHFWESTVQPRFLREKARRTQGAERKAIIIEPPERIDDNENRANKRVSSSSRTKENLRRRKSPSQPSGSPEQRRTGWTLDIKQESPAPLPRFT